jgi:hypothetical protein
VAIALTGCSTVQILYTAPKSEGIKEADNKFYWENDTIRITYAFWENRGIMAFSIENKKDFPIYIDWKKSSFINSNVKCDYYLEQEITKSSSASVAANYLYRSIFDWSRWYPLGVSVAQGEAVKYKFERITFIPPHSVTGKATYLIMSNSHINMSKATERELGNSKIKGLVLETSKDSSTIFFRNFLTYSTKESFENEYYINNEFYVRKVIELGAKHLDEMAEPNRFFLNINN